MQAAIDTHRQQLRDLENLLNMKVIEAKLKAYSIETPHEANLMLSGTNQGIKFFCKHKEPGRTIHKIGRVYATNRTKFHVSFITSTPEPSVFYSDPLCFVDWRSSFEAIIERNAWNPLTGCSICKVISVERLSSFSMAAPIEGMMKYIVKFGTSSTQDMDIMTYYIKTYYIMPSGKNFTSGWELVLSRTPNSESCNKAMPHI